VKKLGVTVSFQTDKLDNPKQVAAAYDTRTKQIIVNEIALPHSRDVIAKFNEVMSHEAIHAIVMDLKATNIIAYKQLQRRLEAFHKSFEPHLAGADTITRLFHNKIGSAEMTEEVLNLGLTNKEFAKWLDSIKVESGKKDSQTLWGKLKEIILKAIGRVTGVRTKLDELSDIMDSVMGEDSSADAAYLSLAKRYKAGDKSVEPELRRMVDTAAADAGCTAEDMRTMQHEAPDRENQNLATVMESGLVPKDYWTMPPYEYARGEGAGIPGGYRVIKANKNISDLWWDGNSINELGFDDGNGYVYKNTKNNRKLDDLITCSATGSIIPLSKRFNKMNSDVRYLLTNDNDAKYLELAKDPEKNRAELQLVESTKPTVNSDLE
jgi:hypothetical protein